MRRYFMTFGHILHSFKYLNICLTTILSNNFYIHYNYFSYKLELPVLNNIRDCHFGVFWLGSKSHSNKTSLSELRWMLGGDDDGHYWGLDGNAWHWSRSKIKDHEITGKIVIFKTIGSGTFDVGINFHIRFWWQI